MIKTEKKVSKRLAMGISLVMVVSMLAACSSSVSSSSTDSTPKEGALKEVTLKIFTAGDDKAGKVDVLNALSTLTKDKLNAKFEINFVAFGDYQNKLTMLAASGDNYDAAFTADWFGYANMVNKGAFLILLH